MEKSINKMGTMPVNKLMLTLGAPMIISMVLQAVYNIVDSAFVSNMQGTGEMALNALTLAFPIQMLMVAVSIGTGVGTNALLSRCLGMGDSKKAARVGGNAMLLAIIIYVLCLIFGIFGVGVYIGTQTTNSQIYDMATDYLSICSVISMGIVFFSIFEKMLQATGLSLYSTVAQITGAVINIILDPIMIYGLFGLPQMGVKGAAYATVIGQIAQALMSAMTYGFNIKLVRIDEAMVTAYGLFYKIQQFILFAAFGLRDAITPIISFNHGKGDKERVKDGIKYGMLYTFIIMVIGIALLEIFALPFSAVFGLSGTTQSLCVSAMRIIAVSFIFAGANIAYQGIFQALQSGIESLIISVCRQILFVLPVAWGFSFLAIQSMDNAWLVWLTFPISEIISAIIGTIFMISINKKKVNTLSD